MKESNTETIEINSEPEDNSANKSCLNTKRDDPSPKPKKSAKKNPPPPKRHFDPLLRTVPVTSPWTKRISKGSPPTSTQPHKKPKLSPEKAHSTSTITVGTQTSITAPPSNHSIFTVTGEIKNTFTNQVKLEFKLGSIVSINGFDMSDGRWESRKHAPTLFGTVDDPKDCDSICAKKLKEDESLVSFVLSGESEWLDKNKPNILKSSFKNSKLTLAS